MEIALCLTGFIRDENNIYNITNFFNNINSDKLKKLTIYYCCPSKIEETDQNPFDTNYILNLFKKQENAKIEIIISFRDYDKQPFIDYANELGLPYVNRHKYHSYRIISYLNSISETTNIMMDTPKFNFIMVSRLDIIDYVLSIHKIFDNNLVLYNSAYVWRTHPYVSTGELANHVEDRFFICSNECIHILKDLFLSLKNENIQNILKTEIGSEEILGYIFNNYENIQKYHLYNLEISNRINKYSEDRVRIKYSSDFLCM